MKKHLFVMNERSEWIWKQYFRFFLFIIYLLKFTILNSFFSIFRYVMAGFVIQNGAICIVLVLICHFVYKTFDTKYLYYPYKML